MSKAFHWVMRHIITDQMLIDELKHRGHNEFTITTANDIGGERMLQL